MRLKALKNFIEDETFVFYYRLRRNQIRLELKLKKKYL